MAIIHNHTKNRVNICCGEFSVDLKADESIEITEENLNGKTELYISLVGFTHVREKLVEEVKKEKIRNRYYLNVEIQRRFPLITVLDIKNLSEVTLEAEEIPLRTIMIFKTAYLQRIRCRINHIEFADVQYMFFCEQDKQDFLRLMRWGCAFAFPVALIAILGMIGTIFNNQDGIIEKITISLLCLGIAVVGFSDLYYTIKAKKWEAFNTENITPYDEPLK